MRIDITKTTSEILVELGARLRGYRLQQNRSVEDVARDAGVGARTVIRAEAGERPTLETVIKLLRALGRIDVLDAFLPPPLISPIQLAKRQGVKRQRAGSPRRVNVSDEPPASHD